jgi:hypothetical protein
VKNDDRGQEHDAVLFNQEGDDRKREQREPPHDPASTHRFPPDQRDQYHDRFDQMHLVRDPRDE